MAKLRTHTMAAQKYHDVVAHRTLWRKASNTLSERTEVGGVSSQIPSGEKKKGWVHVFTDTFGNDKSYR